jgi:crotonobetainyl-CoA:carnitine CoA-transferase CaiB-like acyl-CoA transferase
MAGKALAGRRVLECGDFVAAPYAATLLGHLGADVIKVEPPEGDSNRRRGPYPPGSAGPETGGLHLFLDQAKRSVVLDLDTEPGGLEDPSLPPLTPFEQQAHYQAGVDAAVVARAGVMARDVYGIGQQTDVSVQAVLASQTENGIFHCGARWRR